MTILEPEYHHHEEFRNRSRKLEEIKQTGIDPFPPHFSPSSTLGSIAQNWESKELGTSEDAAGGTTESVTVAGRLVLFRAMGKNAFAQIQDETGRIQIMFNRDLTQVEGFQPTAEMSSLKFIEKKIDLGDIIGIEGQPLPHPKRRSDPLCKTSDPSLQKPASLPDKHSGLADKGVRYRKRWLDLDRQSRCRPHLHDALAHPQTHPRIF